MAVYRKGRDSITASPLEAQRQLPTIALKLAALVAVMSDYRDVKNRRSLR